jgi:hypothetical protein
MSVSVNDTTCLRCGGVLEDGFLLDRAQGANLTATWIAGEPEKSFWSGLQLKGRATFRVTAYRCMQCGRLELYTPCAEEHLLRPLEGSASQDSEALLRASDQEED